MDRCFHIWHGVIENTGHNGIIDANMISGYGLRIAYLIFFLFGTPSLTKVGLEKPTNIQTLL
jgi:hypothetical protein